MDYLSFEVKYAVIGKDGREYEFITADYTKGSFCGNHAGQESCITFLPSNLFSG